MMRIDQEGRPRGMSRDQNRAVQQVSNSAISTEKKRKGIREHLGSCGLTDTEIMTMMRGLLGLYDGSFKDMEFEEKRDSLVFLHTYLGEGRQEVHSRVCTLCGRVLCERGKIHDDTEEVMITEVSTKIAGIVRTDPYHSVRTVASLVLIRLGAIHSKDIRIQDFLPGLLCSNQIHACTTLNDVLGHFGARSLKTLFGYLDQQKGKYPSVLIRVLEAFCEDRLRGLDKKWARIQLESHCWLKETAAGARSGEIRQESLPFPGRNKGKELNERFVRIRSNNSAYAKGG